MTLDRRKLLVLVALVLGWAGILAARWLTPEARPIAPAGARPAARAPKPADGVGGGLPRLKLELLQAPLPPLRDDPHNIFASLIPPPPPAAPPPPPAPAVAPPAPAAPPPPPPDPFLEEAKKIRLLGIVRSSTEVRAVFEVGSEVVVAAERETVKGQFVVKQIQEESVILASRDGAKQVTLSLATEAKK